MPPELPPLEEAIPRLRTAGGYLWLLESGREYWDVETVWQALRGAGFTRLEERTVRGWFKTLPNTHAFSGRLGSYAARQDLIRFFAGRILAHRPVDEGDVEDDASGSGAGE